MYNKNDDSAYVLVVAAVIDPFSKLQVVPSASIDIDVPDDI